mgnify:CR=1 FL=1
MLFRSEAFPRPRGARLLLQLDAAAKRLRRFAAIQAMWAADGWRIACEPEFRFSGVRPFAGTSEDVPFKGSVDRIDERRGEDGRMEYRLIDYKTWDRRQGAAKRILAGGAAEERHAARLRLPTTPPDEKGRRKRFLSVQLPLYARCLELAAPDIFLSPGGESRITDACYLLLGRSDADAGVLFSRFPQGPFAAGGKDAPALLDLAPLALETARAAVARIRANIFWPPGPSETWKYDVKDFLVFSPERDFPRGTAWRDRQEAKLDALAREADGALPGGEVAP